MFLTTEESGGFLITIQNFQKKKITNKKFNQKAEKLYNIYY